eukprot:evm.model.NODE_24622_length_62854_cov_30.334282.8
MAGGCHVTKAPSGLDPFSRIYSEPDQRRKVDEQFFAFFCVCQLNGIESTLSVWEAQIKARNFKKLLDDGERNRGICTGIRKKCGPVLPAVIHNCIPDLFRGSEDGKELIHHGQDQRKALRAQAIVEPASNHPVKGSGYQRQGHGPGQHAAPIPHLELKALSLLGLIYHSRTTRERRVVMIGVPSGMASHGGGGSWTAQEVKLPGGPVEEEGLEKLWRKTHSVCWSWVWCVVVGESVSHRVCVESERVRSGIYVSRGCNWSMVGT